MKRPYTRLKCRVFLYVEDTIRTSDPTSDVFWDSKANEFVCGDLWS